MSEKYRQKIIARLDQAASQLMPNPDLVALDWFNGRRYPMINDHAKSAFNGLDLSTTTPQLYAALAMAAVFGSKRIFDDLISRGLRLNAIIAVGGIAKKSPYIMQMLADILNRPIMVCKSEQCCATGAAIYAATAAGIYPSILAASEQISEGCEHTYQPDLQKSGCYEKLYKKYLRLAHHTDALFSEPKEL